MVAQMLTQIGSGIAEQGGVPLQTEGLAPPTADDPRGAGRGRFGGQYLPQGAMATLLRSTAFFDGAGATSAIAVLTCWAVVGTALIVITAVRQGRSAPA
jgi:hypothetical protein